MNALFEPYYFSPCQRGNVNDIGMRSSSRWVQPAPQKLELHPGEAKEQVRAPRDHGGL